MADLSEHLGRVVREAWVAWAKEQPNPKPSWLLPWEELTEPEREVDRRIAEAVVAAYCNSTGGEDLRDPESPCDTYDAGSPSGTCQSDGHYLCKKCLNMSVDTQVQSSKENNWYKVRAWNGH